MSLFMVVGGACTGQWEELVQVDRRSLCRVMRGACAGRWEELVQGRSTPELIQRWFGEETGLQSSARARHKEPGMLCDVSQWALAARITYYRR